MAQKAGKIWREHGALEYRECVGDDLKVKMGVPFPRMVKVKPGETVVFSWIVYKSRAHRDRVNAKVMKDPRLTKMMTRGAMPFDVKRMVYGGFKTWSSICDGRRPPPLPPRLLAAAAEREVTSARSRMRAGLERCATGGVADLQQQRDVAVARHTDRMAGTPGRSCGR